MESTPEPEMEFPRDDPPPYTPPVPNPATAPPSVVKPQTIFGPHPMQITCANCHQQITTSIVHAYGSCTIISVVAIFILFCPLFWLPLIIDSCKDVHHMCPACNNIQGTFKVI